MVGVMESMESMMLMTPVPVRKGGGRVWRRRTPTPVKKGGVWNLLTREVSASRSDSEVGTERPTPIPNTK